ncbi:MAG: NUDIX domain-containing protein [Candidatus Micrarchaeota archaeon]|nr:NUDIX domain-containing protein [Candidatus Micrarchaeota archaeon]
MGDSISEELVDIYDKENKPNGMVKSRAEAHKSRLFHRTVHIWVYTADSKVLIQLRANTEQNPNLWDLSVAGHVDAGEEPVDAAVREIKEELGIGIERSKLEFIMINRDSYHFQYVYIFRFDGMLNKLKPQLEEVRELSLVPIDEFENGLRTSPDKYVMRGQYWFEMINEIRNRCKV